jgi:hypothetical protein
MLAKILAIEEIYFPDREKEKKNIERGTTSVVLSFSETALYQG